MINNLTPNKIPNTDTDITFNRTIEFKVLKYVIVRV